MFSLANLFLPHYSGRAVRSTGLGEHARALLICAGARIAWFQTEIIEEVVGEVAIIHPTTAIPAFTAGCVENWRSTFIT